LTCGEEAMQQVLEGTEALQDRAGEVALQAEWWVQQAPEKLPAAGGGAHRVADSRGEATAAARCGVAVAVLLVLRACSVEQVRPCPWRCLGPLGVLITLADRSR